jgi:hypothetical protein
LETTTGFYWREAMQGDDRIAAAQIFALIMPVALILGAYLLASRFRRPVFGTKYREVQIFDHESGELQTHKVLNVLAFAAIAALSLGTGITTLLVGMLITTAPRGIIIVVSIGLVGVVWMIVTSEEAAETSPSS